MPGPLNRPRVPRDQQLSHREPYHAITKNIILIMLLAIVAFSFTGVAQAQSVGAARDAFYKDLRAHANGKATLKNVERSYNRLQKAKRKRDAKEKKAMLNAGNGAADAYKAIPRPVGCNPTPPPCGGILLPARVFNHKDALSTDGTRNLRIEARGDLKLNRNEMTIKTRSTVDFKSGGTVTIEGSLIQLN